MCLLMTSSLIRRGGKGIIPQSRWMGKNSKHNRHCEWHDGTMGYFYNGVLTTVEYSISRIGVSSFGLSGCE